MTTLKKIKKKKLNPKKFVMRIDPEIDEAVDQALAIAERGKLIAAEEIISKLLRENSDLSIVHYAMGVICAMKGQYDESIAYFDRAIEIFPYFVQAWFNKGASHQKNLEVEEMISAFQKVVELGDPREDFVRHAKTIITELEQQIRKDKGQTLAGYMKGWNRFKEAFAAMEKGEWEKALSRFQEVLAIDPKHTQSYGNMGLCYARLGHKQEALAAFDKALELDPKYEPAIMNRAAVSLLKEGEKLEDKVKLRTVEYYKDQSMREKSLMERLLGRFGM
jgi:tetratricopeptide (TPR) repeat protein